MFQLHWDSVYWEQLWCYFPAVSNVLYNTASNYIRNIDFFTSIDCFFFLSVSINKLIKKVSLFTMCGCYQSYPLDGACVKAVSNRNSCCQMGNWLVSPLNRKSVVIFTRYFPTGPPTPDATAVISNISCFVNDVTFSKLPYLCCQVYGHSLVKLSQS